MGDVNVALRVTMQLNKSGAVYSVLGYLEQGAVVAGKALVLQGDVDTLPGPQVDAGVRKALPHLQQVLLHRGGGPRQGLEVAPLLHAGDHTGGGVDIHHSTSITTFKSHLKMDLFRQASSLQVSCIGTGNDPTLLSLYTCTLFYYALFFFLFFLLAPMTIL